MKNKFVLDQSIRHIMAIFELVDKIANAVQRNQTKVGIFLD